MVFAAAFLTVLAGVLPDAPQDEAELLGEKKVCVKTAWFTKAPSWSAEPARKAEDGEDVTVTALKGKYSQCTAKSDKLTAWIASNALTPPEKFSRSAADEKEGQKLAAQGLEGQKGLNPDTEKEYRSQGGPERDNAYKEMDAWLARPSYREDRAALIARLKEFRQAGKLGEFSPVK
jgi:hypothetical protein